MFTQLAIAPKAFISARKAWYLLSASDGTAGLGAADAVCGTRLVGISPKPDMAEAAAWLRGLAAVTPCSRLTRTDAGTMAVTVLSSFALGILTTVDCPVKVDWVSFFAFVIAETPGGGPAMYPDQCCHPKMRRVAGIIAFCISVHGISG